jgi:hypothetical protein
MGLDITAYRKLTKVEVELDEDGHPADESVYDSHAIAWVNGGRGQHDHLEHKAFYCYDGEFDFRAGSYSGYNEWREALARFAGYEKSEYKDSFRGIVKSSHAATCWDGETQGAFAEMIDFSDAEGCIGPVTSAKLAKDFAEHEERARTFVAWPDDDGWFFRQYLEWKKAFEMASDDGMVQFH